MISCIVNKLRQAVCTYSSAVIGWAEICAKLAGLLTRLRLLALANVKARAAETTAKIVIFMMLFCCQVLINYKWSSI